MLPGVWDLRGHESAYLGGVDLAGMRVLELGPATGYLTFYMERMGAEVVSFEAGFDVSIDTLPVKGEDQPGERLRVMQETIDRNHDAWWYLHRTLGSSARFVQGNIYDMPADLGTFDITLVGAILLHLREPWGALSQAARRTTGTMIVTEPLQDDLDPPESNIMRFSPSAEHHLTNWWSIYPGAVVSMLVAAGLRRHRDDHAHPTPPPGPQHRDRGHRPAHVHRRRSTAVLIRRCARPRQNRPGVPRPRSTTVVRNSSSARHEHGPPEMPVDEGRAAPPQLGPQPGVGDEPVEHGLEFRVRAEPQSPAGALAMLPGRPAGPVDQDG